MSRCIVFGPRDVDVATIIAANCPDGTITKFDDNGGVVAVLPEGSENTLRARGLHLVVINDNLHAVVWLPFIIKRSLGDPFTNLLPILDVLQNHFNVREKPEHKDTFEFPVPLSPSSDGRPEYDFIQEVIAHITRVMEKAGILIEIGPGTM